MYTRFFPQLELVLERILICPMESKWHSKRRVGAVCAGLIKSILLGLFIWKARGGKIWGGKISFHYSHNTFVPVQSKRGVEGLFQQHGMQNVRFTFKSTTWTQCVRSCTAFLEKETVTFTLKRWKSLFFTSLLLWKTIQSNYSTTIKLQRILHTADIGGGLFMMAAVCSKACENGHVRHVSTPQRGVGSHLVTVSSVLCSTICYCCTDSLSTPTVSQCQKFICWALTSPSALLPQNGM